MSVMLNELLEKIKKEGVLEAEKQAAEIAKQAQTSADRIISEARVQADSIVAEAEKAAAQFEFSSQEAVRQAARNLILQVRKELSLLFDAVLQTKISGTLDNELIKKAIVTLIEAWGKHKELNLEVVLPEPQAQALTEMVFKSLSETLRRGVTIKPSSEIDAGFKIGEKDGSAYYDFTDRGIAALLSEYLNPRVKACLSAGE